MITNTAPARISNQMKQPCMRNLAPLKRPAMNEENDGDHEADDAEDDPHPSEAMAERRRRIVRQAAMQLPQRDNAQANAGDAENEQRPELDETEDAKHQRRDRERIAIVNPIAPRPGARVVFGG